MRPISFLLPIVGCMLGHAYAGNHKYDRTKPAGDSLVVDRTGQHAGSLTTIGAAVRALRNTTAPQNIFVLPGVYTEQVYIPRLGGPLVIQGYTQDARSYKDNTVTLTFNLSRQTPGLANNDATSTLRVWTSNVKIYNLNIANTFGRAETNGQALALSAQNTNQGYYACNFTGYQDTIYANDGRQIYANSFVNGAVDFIFGQRAIAWFENVKIETIGPGFITANGRDSANNTSVFVFNKSKVSGSSGPSSTYLGRPWRLYSRVIFQKTYLGDVVNPQGWSRWDTVQSVGSVFYREYKNFGPGSNISSRAEFSSQLEKSVKIEDVLGSKLKEEFWVDRNYI